MPRVLVPLVSHSINGIADCKYELPSLRSGAKPSPTLLFGQKGAKDLVPSPLGRGLG